MAHGVLAPVELMLGNIQAALTETERAVACEADPIYALASALWSAGTNAPMGDADQARHMIDEFRPLTVQFELPTSRDFFDTFSAMLAIASGQMSRGARELAEIRERAERAGNAWNCLQIDMFFALLYARIATGEVTGSLAGALRNPGFVLRHARGAGKRGRAALEHLAATIDARGNQGQRPALEFELAKLAKHDRRSDDARIHAQRVVELLGDEPDATLYRNASDLLKTL
jgi:hypothetical protein